MRLHLVFQHVDLLVQGDGQPGERGHGGGVGSTLRGGDLQLRFAPRGLDRCGLGVPVTSAVPGRDGGDLRFRQLRSLLRGG
ncbi:hypothetical protein ACPA54_30880 [Uniformispora flossi]|uniref:hypothetical protein n=1 Tax=Uniformispora flossi TaxID=3390723 RepID=UPI003C3073E3